MTLQNKLNALKKRLAEFDAAAIAFSGGVDSTFLLSVARDVLGSERIVALTAFSPIFPSHEFEESKALAMDLGVRQIVVTSNELDLPDFAANPPLRCYYCKRELFARFLARARELGILVVLDGSNLDDLDDYRPGRKALAELKIASPLLEAGLTKADIRELSKQAGLPTADKPSFACLASRFPYGTRITLERLQQIERCETFLRQHGFRTFRVRHHGEIARIEVNLDEMPRMIKDRLRIALLAECKAAGFTYVALDLGGYRTGSLNESLFLDTD
ncbi:MAG: ATP-dependent sacrificial sulfur transferase LarE [Desulfuromonadales bacterium]|nr:ATP-dependent sacrificial sulfur transferase LarE [Desulfuromonadales bacterium]